MNHPARALSDRQSSVEPRVKTPLTGQNACVPSGQLFTAVPELMTAIAHASNLLRKGAPTRLVVPNMSKLEHAGASSTVPPAGHRSRLPYRHRPSSPRRARAPRFRGRIAPGPGFTDGDDPPSLLCDPRRARSSTAPPLYGPPRMTTTPRLKLSWPGAPKRVLVAFESLTYVMPSMTSTRSSACGKPWKPDNARAWARARTPADTPPQRRRHVA